MAASMKNMTVADSWARMLGTERLMMSLSF
jgi:hypothetical protein